MQLSPLEQYFQVHKARSLIFLPAESLTFKMESLLDDLSSKVSVLFNFVSQASLILICFQLPL